MEEYVVTVQITLRVKESSKYMAQMGAVNEVLDNLGKCEIKLLNVIPVVDKRCLV